MDLDRVRPVTGDEAWIASVSHKLATQGVLGADLYAGFFRAEDHYFLNLPGHHVLQASAFRLFGPGIAVARWVSVASGVALVWAVTLLAMRWYGVAVAVLTGGLMILWRSHVVAMDLGVPLLSVARSARYDLTAVMWMWVALLLADTTFRRSGWLAALGTGACAGIATLTQFYGFFVILVIGAAWLWQFGVKGLREPTIRWMAGGFAVVLLPYAVHVASHWHDAADQVRHAFPARLPSAGVEALLDGITREPLRYLRRLEPRLGRWVLLVGIWPALAVLWTRVRGGRDVGDRLVALTLVVPVVLFAFLETTKATLYAFVFWPSICIVAALGVVALAKRALARGTGWWKAAALFGVGLMCAVAVEGLGAYWYDRRSSAGISDYGVVGRSVGGLLPGGAKVAGSARWAWALRGRDYVALHNLRLQWLARSTAPRSGHTVAEFIQAAGVEYVVVDADVRSDLERSADEFAAGVTNLLQNCTRRGGERTDRTYGKIEVRRIVPAAACPLGDG